jgi:hypothetical protein
MTTQRTSAVFSWMQDFNAEVCAISVEGKLPRYAATLGEVDEVE